VIDAAVKAGISERTLRRARMQLEIESNPVEFTDGVAWGWRLKCDPSAAAAPEPAKPENPSEDAKAAPHELANPCSAGA
jgi:hypothetical protein